MAKSISYVLGIILVLLGLIGFVNNPIFGVFAVGTVHNVILIILGLILLGMAAANAKAGAKTVGIITAIVAILGFIPPTTTVIGIADTNVASSVLQAIVAIILLYAGFAGSSSDEEMASMPREGGGQQGGGMGPQQ